MGRVIDTESLALRRPFSKDRRDSNEAGDGSPAIHSSVHVTIVAMIVV